MRIGDWGKLALTEAGEPEQLQGTGITPNLFPLLGINPALGRNFSPEENQTGRDRVAILSFGLWQRRFAAEPNLVGGTIRLNGENHVVVGVMPQGLQFPFETDVWLPLSQLGSDLLTNRVRHPLTCANVANLLLARAAGRQQEVAMRAALGAGRGRLFRQFLTESRLLAGLGGAGGLLLAAVSLPLLRAALSNVAPEQLPALQTVSLDLFLLGFTLFITLLTGVLFGLIPAFRLARLNLNQSLKEGGKAAAGSARGLASRTLVVADVTLTLVALVGAGLLLKSFQRLMQVDPGFRTDHLLSAQLTLPETKYAQADQVKSFHQQLLPRLAALPSVECVATIDYFLLATSNAKTRFAVEGAPRPAAGQFPVAQTRAVNQDYFRVMGIALSRGRAFTEDDLLNKRSCYVINETLARRYFPNEDTVCKQLVMGVMFPNPVNAPIIGVVADVKDLGMMAPVKPTIYSPGFSRQPLLMIRTTGEPAALATAVRQAVAATDSEQPVQRLRTMDAAVSASLARQRLSAVLTGAFAALALLLAALGLYGVLAWSVSGRTRELGIRMALGAKKRDILKLVLGQGLKLMLIGAAIGLALSLALTRFLSALLFGVSAYDPITFVAITLLLTGVALMASYLPARRATKVDPMVALRVE